MKSMSGKVAFITGGASGIGLAMARAFGREGMKVMIADIEETRLARAVEDLEASQVTAAGVLCDVADRGDVRKAALATIAAFGKVHVVCNNAGVGAGGPIEEVPERDWDWIVDVNLKGVVHGTEVFTPLIASHGEGGHFVNTASMAGMISPPGMEPYNATKFAVVAMSEGWRQQLQPRGIGVSVLCPGFVKTEIWNSGRNKPSRYGAKGAAAAADSPGRQLVESGIDPMVLAVRVIECVKADELYIFTHADLRGAVEARFAGIMAGFDSAAKSAALAGVKTQQLGSDAGGGAVSELFRQTANRG